MDGMQRNFELSGHVSQDRGPQPTSLTHVIICAMLVFSHPCCHCLPCGMKERGNKDVPQNLWTRLTPAMPKKNGHNNVGSTMLHSANPFAISAQEASFLTGAIIGISRVENM